MINQNKPIRVLIKPDTISFIKTVIFNISILFLGILFLDKIYYLTKEILDIFVFLMQKENV